MGFALDKTVFSKHSRKTATALPGSSKRAEISNTCPHFPAKPLRLGMKAGLISGLSSLPLLSPKQFCFSAVFIIIIKATCHGSPKCIELIEKLWGQDHCWKYCFLHFCLALFLFLPFHLLSHTHRKRVLFHTHYEAILVSLTAICTTLPRTRIQKDL